MFTQTINNVIINTPTIKIVPKYVLELKSLMGEYSKISMLNKLNIDTTQINIKGIITNGDIHTWVREYGSAGIKELT